MDQIKTAISGLHVGEPTFRRGLTVFPLTSGRGPKLDYLLLEEGLREGLVSVGEVSHGGSVPELAVENRADRPVLIVDGEELVGAKQNRVANLTLLLAAGKTTIIPVSCVERGRWSYDRPDFRVTERMQYASGRAERYATVQASMRAEGTRRSDQGRVWRGIDETAMAMDAASPTSAMGSIFERHAASLDDYVREIEAVPGQVGALFVVGRGSVGLDVFDQAETLAAFLPKLVRSYGVDALTRSREDAEPAPMRVARDFLDGLRAGSFDDHPSVGLGRDVGIVAEGLIGGALVVDDVTVHLTGFSDPRTQRNAAAQADRRAAERPYATHGQRRNALYRRHRRGAA